MSMMKCFGGKSFLQSDMQSGGSEFVNVREMFCRPYSEDNFFYFTTTTGEQRLKDTTPLDNSDDVFVDGDVTMEDEYDPKYIHVACTY